jgi:hypothetical protein
MESLMELLGAGASVAGGGIFGLFGAVVGQVSKHFQEKAARAWEEKKWAHEEKLFDQQIALGKSETENEIAIASAVGSWNGLSESIKADAATVAQSPWASNVKALFRPFLTTALILCSMYITHSLMFGALAEVLTVAETTALLRYAVYSIIFSTAAAITWWFGDRALTPPHLKHR